MPEVNNIRFNRTLRLGHKIPLNRENCKTTWQRNKGSFQRKIMAAIFFHVKPVFNKIVKDFNKSKGFIHYPSSKSFRNIHYLSHECSSEYGMLKDHNSVVNTGVTLNNQKKLIFLPGLNVGLGKFKKLHAKVPGRVLVTSERTNFKPDHFIVQTSFPNYPPVYRKYMHVIPEPLHRRFKLIEKF